MVKDLELVEALVIHRAHVNSEHLVGMVSIDTYNMLRVLLTRLKTMNWNESFHIETALSVSVWGAHHQCLKMLISAGANVNILLVCILGSQSAW